MGKDFQQWHLKKSSLHQIPGRPFFHEREIWFCSLGLNVGFEQDGRGEDFLRPVIVLRKFNNEIFWAVPLTKSHAKDPERSVYYVPFSFMPDVMSAAILSQLRLIDARRLARLIGMVP